jgi:hypothetical protein
VRDVSKGAEGAHGRRCAATRSHLKLVELRCVDEELAACNERHAVLPDQTLPRLAREVGLAVRLEDGLREGGHLGHERLQRDELAAPGPAGGRDVQQRGGVQQPLDLHAARLHLRRHRLQVVHGADGARAAAAEEQLRAGHHALVLHQVRDHRRHNCGSASQSLAACEHTRYALRGAHSASRGSYSQTWRRSCPRRHSKSRSSSTAGRGRISGCAHGVRALSRPHLDVDAVRGAPRRAAVRGEDAALRHDGRPVGGAHPVLVVLVPLVARTFAPAEHRALQVHQPAVGHGAAAAGDVVRRGRAVWAREGRPQGRQARERRATLAHPGAHGWLTRCGRGGRRVSAGRRP